MNSTRDRIDAAAEQHGWTRKASEVGLSVEYRQGTRRVSVEYIGRTGALAYASRQTGSYGGTSLGTHNRDKAATVLDWLASPRWTKRQAA